MIEITRITPQGFCKGVHYSIHLVKKTIESSTTPKPIYILGDLVHNKHISASLTNLGVITLNGDNRLDMLKTVKRGTVVITAHGASEEVTKIALSKGLHVVDATCRDVIKTHTIIKEKLNEGYTVLFYGKSGHPETEGVLSISSKVILIEKDTHLETLPILDTKLALSTQTTMSFLEVYQLHQNLLLKYPKIELLDEVCNATRLRQEAILSQTILFDLFIVVGDVLSNNTEMLYQIASKQYPNTIKVQTVEDLNGIDLTAVHTIGITSGASTPTKIVDEIIDSIDKYAQIKNHHYKSTLSSDDFLF